jgi:hypothetical protein
MVPGSTLTAAHQAAGELAMVQPANRHGEFITVLSSERARLGKAQVMRFRW